MSIPCLARATIFEITVTDQLAGMSVWDLLTKTRSASWKGKTLKFLLIQMKSTECDEECSVKPTLEEERKSTIQCFVPHTNLELSTEGGRRKSGSCCKPGAVWRVPLAQKTQRIGHGHPCCTAVPCPAGADTGLGPWEGCSVKHHHWNGRCDPIAWQCPVFVIARPQIWNTETVASQAGLWEQLGNEEFALLLQQHPAQYCKGLHMVKGKQQRTETTRPWSCTACCCCPCCGPLLWSSASPGRLSAQGVWASRRPASFTAMFSPWKAPAAIPLS